jgi:hypothetical protein
MGPPAAVRAPLHTRTTRATSVQSLRLGFVLVGEQRGKAASRVRFRIEDGLVAERSRICRAGLRPPIPLSPEEEMRGRPGF